jgi:hypothetical protein
LGRDRGRRRLVDMTAPRDEARDELHQLVERLPDEQVQAAASELRARLTSVGRGVSWPPAWFAVAEGSSDDISERVEEIIAEGLGRRPA